MLKAIKANRVLRIPEERKNDYIALGYKITDMNGKTISEPANPEKKVAEQEEKIAGLEKQLEEVTSESGKKDAEIKDLSEKLEAAEKNVEAANAKIAGLEKQLATMAASAKTSATKPATKTAEKTADTGKEDPKAETP